MRIAIYGRPFNLDVLPYVQEVFDNLSQHGVEIYVYHQLSDYLADKIKKVTYNTLGPDVNIKGFIDLFITLGGDGTLLDMVCVIRNTGVPVIGINFGRLGFLATINKSDIAAAIYAVVNKEYTLDSRDLISINSENEVFGDDNFALNDITIHKRDDAAMIITRVYMNNEFLNAYWGDGIIISTPTGSTAYSLSCGGPIIFPQSNSLVLTPVSPHNLNVRPVVLPDSSNITFEVESRSSNYLVSCDSRTATIDKTMRFSVQKAGFQLNLVRLSNESYLSTLRNKLLWGLDVRNY
jgi:NAD+ kinase